MKRQRNTTQVKEQARNTEVQINEEEIGNLQTTQLLKLKILQKESIAEYLKQMNELVSWNIKQWK